MNYKKTNVDNLLMDKMKIYKHQFEKDIADNINRQIITLDEFLKGLNECDKKGLQDTKIIWNLSGFINITSIDLKIIYRDLAIEENDWSQRYYIRQAYLLIYEFYSTYYSEQKDFYIMINKKLNISMLNEEKQNVIKLLREYKKQYERYFYTVRNNTIAHRDINIKEQISMIENLNYSEAMEIISNFDKILNQLGAFMQKVIKIDIDNLPK